MIPPKQNRRPRTTRNLKNADCDADFFFITMVNALSSTRWKCGHAAGFSLCATRSKADACAFGDAHRLEDKTTHPCRGALVFKENLRCGFLFHQNNTISLLAVLLTPLSSKSRTPF